MRCVNLFIFGLSILVAQLGTTLVRADAECPLNETQIQNVRSWTKDSEAGKLSQRATMDWYLTEILGTKNRCECIERYRAKQYDLWNSPNTPSAAEGAVCISEARSGSPDQGAISETRSNTQTILNKAGLSKNDPRAIMMTEAERLSNQMRERILSDTDVIEAELKKLGIKELSMADLDDVADAWGDHVLQGGASGIFGSYIRQYVSQQGVCEYYYGTEEGNTRDCNFRTGTTGTHKKFAGAQTDEGCRELESQCKDKWWGTTPPPPSSNLYRPVEWQEFVDMRSHGMRCAFYDQFFSDKCPKKTQAKDVIDFLIERAREPADGAFYDRGLTPYHARMLAIHLIENEMRNRYGDEADAKLDAFAAKLTMKHGPSPGSAPKRFKDSYFMNGYALASSSAGTAQLFAENSKFGSTECSASMARLMALADPAHLRGYSESTAGMAVRDYACFERVPLVNEIQLQPGDIVVEREEGQAIGHTFIFMGWKKTSTGGTSMQIIHSTGGGNRSAMLEQSYPSDDKPLYTDGNCEVNGIFRSLSDERQNDKANYQIIRPKTGSRAGDCFYGSR